MANYKSGYKKKKNDRFVSYIFIGFAITFIILIISVVFYNIFTRELEYTSFTHIEYEQTIYDMPEDEYLVYFYTEECGACIALKQEVLEFADDNNADIEVYFVDLDIVNSGGTLFVPDAVTHTPTLIVVKDGLPVDLIMGASEDDIPAVFDEINAGSIIYLD